MVLFYHLKCLAGVIVINNNRYLVTQVSVEMARTKYTSYPIFELLASRKMVNEFMKCPHGMVVLEIISSNGVNVAGSNNNPAIESYKTMLDIKLSKASLPCSPPIL